MEDFTAATLIQAVREDANLGPETSESFPTDAVILRWLNEEMKNCATPALMKPREERFVANERFTTTTGEAEYSIPERSLWSDLRDVQVLAPGQTPEFWWSLYPIRPEQANPGAGWGWNWFLVPNAQYPAGYYIQDNAIVLWPPPPGEYVMRKRYFRRPGRIVATGYSAASDVSLATGTYTVTVASTSGMSSGRFDILSPDYPCSVLAQDLVGTKVDATTLTFAAADLTDEQIAVLVDAGTNGDLFIASGDAPCPQIPQDLVPLLIARGTYRAMKQKQNPGWKDQLNSAEMLEAKLVKVYEPRADGLAQTAVVTNAPGMGGWLGW